MTIDDTFNFLFLTHLIPNKKRCTTFYILLQIWNILFTDSNVSYVAWFVCIFIDVFAICCVAIYFEIFDYDLQYSRLSNYILLELIGITMWIKYIRSELADRNEFDSYPIDLTRIFTDLTNYRHYRQNRLQGWEPSSNGYICYMVITSVGRLLRLCFIISLICATFFFAYTFLQYL